MTSDNATKAGRRRNNSIRNPDYCQNWRENRRAEGWEHVQFWANRHVAAKLRALVDQARLVSPDITQKEVLQDLILSARMPT